MPPGRQTRKPFSTLPPPSLVGGVTEELHPRAGSKSWAGAGGGGTRPREGRARPGDWSWRRRHSPGRGPPYGKEDGTPQTVRNGDARIGRKEVTREMKGAPRLQVGAGTPLPPTPGGRVTLGKLLKGLEKELEAPPPGQESGEKVLSGPGPSHSGGAARPLPASGPSRCRPSPSPAPTLPLHRLRAVSLCPSQRAISLLSPLTFLGGSAAFPLTPPADTVHTHCLRSRTHSPSLTHTARPRLQSGPHIMRHSRATCPARECARAELARG